MYYYLEKPKDDAALKKEYLEKIRELRPHLDEGFFKIASCPENIIIRKNMVCEVSLDYEIFMKMSYVEKVTSDYTKGYKIEARSDHLYVSEDRGSLQYRSNASDIFNFKVTKRLSVDKNNVETLYSEDSRNVNRYVSLDSYRDADTISQCFNLVGYSSESAFFDRIGLKVKEESIYSSEKESAERKIRSRDPEVRSIRCEGIQVPSGDVLNYGDGIIRFKYIYHICVRYDGIEYDTKYSEDSFCGKPGVKFSQKSLKEAEDRTKRVKKILCKKRGIDITIFIGLFLLTAFLFVVTVGFREYAYEISWMRFFGRFPENLLVLIPLLLTIIAFRMVLHEFSEQISYLPEDPSDETANDLIKSAMSNVRPKRIFLYVMVVITAVYLVLQSYVCVFGTRIPLPEKEPPLGDVCSIRTEEDLLRIPSNYEGTVTLENDLDLNGIEFAGIDLFRGEFDGKGHVISNFTLQREDPGDIGFFYS